MTRSTQRRRGRGWILLAWGLLLLGVSGSVTGAGLYRGYLNGQANQSITATASDVGAAFGAQLRRDGDLTATVRTLVETNPNLTNPEFASWFKAMGVTERYPEAKGFGFVQPVLPSQLAAYIAKANSDPTVNPAVPSTPFKLSPPGVRPIYCLGRIGASTSGLGGFFPNGFDACANPMFSPSLWLAADTGQVIMVPIGANNFAMIAPVYRDRVVPAAPKDRRPQLIAWTGGIFDAGPLMTSVAGGQRNLSLTLYRQNPGAGRVLVATSLKSVAAHPLQRTVAVQADGQWLVTVIAPATYGWLSPDLQGLAVLVTGLALSLLLFVLVRVLVGARSRALKLVDEKTGELQHQALHDGLTGLPNRALILDRLENALARSRRQHNAVSALFVDLDNFKDINDTFGHAVGDELLRAVAARLAGALRDSDTVGRLGGDEFVVLAEGNSLDAGPELVAQRLLDVLREPFMLGVAEPFPYSVSASVGVASGDRPTAGDLLRDADVALYQAKALGKNRYVVFQPAMQTAVHDRLELEMDLRYALGEGQMFLVYQPTFDIPTATVTGVEALLRWNHPTRGIVPPDAFIPLAEETGIIIDIGRWVLGEATRQTAAWQADGYMLNVSVNVSARQLESDDLVGEVADALALSGLDPACLTLEITETAIMRDAAATAQRLTALKALGVRIAIDDFGTGYSSLAYLQQFPVDTLKIDRSFISGMVKSDEAAALIHTLIQLGNSLGIETLAEGIEHHDQFARLRDEHCQSGQGFLVARPLNADAVIPFLDSRMAASGTISALTPEALNPA